MIFFSRVLSVPAMHSPLFCHPCKRSPTDRQFVCRPQKFAFYIYNVYNKLCPNIRFKEKTIKTNPCLSKKEDMNIRLSLVTFIVHESCHPPVLSLHFICVSFPIWTGTDCKYFRHIFRDGTPWQKKSIKIKFRSIFVLRIQRRRESIWHGVPITRNRSFRLNPENPLNV